MARYKDADALIKTIFPYDVVDKKFYSINAKAVYDAINNAPTADVVEVVRCKDCQHYINGRCYVKNRKPLFTCDVNIHGCKQNDFCSYGERK